MEEISLVEINRPVDTRRISKCFQCVIFTYDATLGYTWMASSKTRAMNVYPMASTNNVKFFKTLAGAKRNFIKRITGEP